MTTYVIAAKLATDYFGNPSNEWWYIQYGRTPLFGPESHARQFTSESDAFQWWEENAKHLSLKRCDLSTLGIYKKSYIKLHMLGVTEK